MIGKNGSNTNLKGYKPTSGGRGGKIQRASTDVKSMPKKSNRSMKGC